MDIENITLQRHIGYKKFEELRSGGAIEKGDIIIYPEKNSSEIINPVHAQVSDSPYFLDICGTPANLSLKNCGSIGYCAALLKRHWVLIKKQDLSKLEKIPFKERIRIFKKKS